MLAVWPSAPSRSGGANAAKGPIEKELSGLLARRQNRGMVGANTQVMFCGIPNVGKSTFINYLCRFCPRQGGQQPGVTSGKQWISTDNFDLMDMPGVLWKKFDSKTMHRIWPSSAPSGRYPGYRGAGLNLL